MNTVARRLRWLLLLAFVAGSPALADVSMIDLRHRTAEQILPSLREVAPEGAASTGTGFQIIVRADSGALATVKELVRGLDQPVETLRVSVRQSSDSLRSREGAEGGVRIGDGKASGNVRIYSSRGARSGDSVHSVRVQAGQPAWIDTGGTEVIATDRLFAANPRGGAAFGERRRLRDWRDGFFVRVQRRGDEVTLGIEVVREEPLTDGAAAGRELVTTLTGRVGEWIPVGGVDSAVGHRDRRLILRSRDARGTRQTVEVRVGPVP